MPIATPPDLPTAALPPRKKSLRGGYRINRAHPQAQGLVGCWLMAEGTGTNTLDLSPYQNTGTVSTGTAWGTNTNGTGIYPRINSAYVMVADSPSMRPAKFSVFATATWTAALSGVSDFGTLISKNFAAPAWTPPYLSYLLRVNYSSTGNTYQLETSVSDGTTYTGFQTILTPPTIGATYQYGMTYDGAFIRAYINGVLIGSQAYSSAIGYSSQPLTIGADNGAAPRGEYFPGQISNAFVYNRALSAREIQALYQQTLSGGLLAFVQQPNDVAFLSAFSSALTPTNVDAAAPTYARKPLPRLKNLRGGYKINRAHAMAQGLKHCFLLNEGAGTGRDLLVPSATTLSGLTWANGEAGMCLQNNSVMDSLNTTITDFNTASGTVAWRMYPTFAIGNGVQRMMWGNYYPTGSQSLSAQLYSDNNLYMGWFNTGSDTRVIIAASNGVNYAVNAWQTYVLTWTPSGSQLYWNGALVGSAATAPAITTVNGLSIFIGSQNTANAGNNGMTSGSQTSWWMEWSRALSANEISVLDTQTRAGGLPVFVSQPDDAAWFATSSSGQAFVKALTETLALADSRLAATAKNMVESLLLTDSRLAAFGKALSDPLTLTDAAAKAAGKGLVESLSLSDTRTLSLARKLLETLSISDAAVQAVLNAGGQALSKMLAESLGLSDNLGKGLGKRLNDALPLSDTLGKGQAKALLESLTINDARMVGLGKQVTETLALTDSRALNLIKQVTETLNLSDNLNTILGIATVYFFIDVLQSGFKGQGDTLTGGKDNDTISGGRA